MGRRPNPKNFISEQLQNIVGYMPPELNIQEKDVWLAAKNKADTENKSVEECYAGIQVIYIPNHCMDIYFDPGSWHYPNGIQPGFVTSRNKFGDYFVRYWQWDVEKNVYLRELRTKANSECTSWQNLFVMDFFGEHDDYFLIENLVKQIQLERSSL